jgi:hypothetical protein
LIIFPLNTTLKGKTGRVHRHAGGLKLTNFSFFDIGHVHRHAGGLKYIQWDDS